MTPNLRQEAPELLERLEDEPRRHRLGRAAHERRDESRERAGLVGVVDRPHESVGDRLLELLAVEPLLVRERVERLLAAEREYELLARDAELAGDAVDRGERDPLDRLAEAVRLRLLARLARIGDRRRLEASAAEREVRDDDGRDEAERDEERAGRASRGPPPQERDRNERAQRRAPPRAGTAPRTRS